MPVADLTRLSRSVARTQDTSDQSRGEGVPEAGPVLRAGERGQSPRGTLSTGASALGGTGAQPPLSSIPLGEHSQRAHDVIKVGSDREPTVTRRVPATVRLATVRRARCQRRYPCQRGQNSTHRGIASPAPARWGSVRGDAISLRSFDGWARSRGRTRSRRAGLRCAPGPALLVDVVPRWPMPSAVSTAA